MRPAPAPAPDALTEPFWSAGREGVLRLQRCVACGHLRFPPSPVCPRCLDGDATWDAVSGMAELLSFVVFERAYQPEWADRVPYAVLLVQLDEGPCMLSDYAGDPADLEVGARLQVRFEATTGGWSHPLFDLAR